MAIKIRRIKEIQNENFQKLLTKFYQKNRIINKDKFEMMAQDVVGSLFLAKNLKTDLLFPVIIKKYSLFSIFTVTPVLFML